MRRALVPDELRAAPFNVDDAVGAGLTRHSLESAPWRRVLRGVYVHVDLEDTRELRLASVALILPPYAVLCGLTAAWLHGLDVRREADLDVHIGFPKGRRI